MKNHTKTFLIHNISYKTWTGSTPFGIKFDKIDRFIRVNDGVRYLYYLELKKMIPFTTESYIL